MSSNFYIDGVLIESMYGAKGTHTAAATGIKVNGVDLNTIVLALVDGQKGPTSNVKSNSADMDTFFGIPATSLPINGQTFTANPTFAGGISTCILHFITNNGSWSVSGAVTDASGSVPSGAAECQVTFALLSGSTNTTVTNPLASMTTLTATNNDCNLHLTAPQSAPVSSTYSIVIEYANSAGSVISTTTCTFYLNTAGS